MSAEESASSREAPLFYKYLAYNTRHISREIITFAVPKTNFRDNNKIIKYLFLDYESNNSQLV